jgi:cytochrome c oxidase subunit 2
VSIPIWFIPTHEGHYMINCAQLCGNSHAFMRGNFFVMSPAKYDAWLATNAKRGAAPASLE